MKVITCDGWNSICNVDGMPKDFVTLGLSEKIKLNRLKIEFIKNSIEYHVSCKGKSTKNAVIKFIKENDLKQVYAYWKSDSNFYKDDVVVLNAKGWLKNKKLFTENTFEFFL